MLYLYYSKRNILEVIFIRDHIKGGALTETTFLVLLAVYKPNHGYGIMQFVSKATNERVMLGAGTLYGAINTLLKKEWIAKYNEQADTKTKRYIITAIGKQKAVEELQRMKDVQKLALTIMKGGPGK